MKNHDPQGSNILVIYKLGDDLRQDVLTIQMLQVMDMLWKQSGLDLELTPYKCIAMSEDDGMIEVVENSNTLANIQKENGGVTAAFSDTSLLKWLQIESQQDEMEKIVRNFVHSLAGYCVATYVLGIGDRHNDNIMLARSGHFFHIDFGHFLGNIKTFAGIKRETAPFVLTPDCVFVMGKKESVEYAKFVTLCCRAYNAVRGHGNFIINLFNMMVCTGIPELTSAKDLEYLRTAFNLTFTDPQAAAAFADLIELSLNTKTTQVNFAIHILAHPKVSRDRSKSDGH
eukprot:TRINITY_DN6269_c0_g1_i4.p1 TRINITY_DN6269_c0_g1~~TRINITY_DN6269_c0_g1_i4.p1  ORF type:complete len:285 (+),score=58.38 TRINITY_DN6269_c0_g1_i4:544-1398(+)